MKMHTLHYTYTKGLKKLHTLLRSDNTHKGVLVTHLRNLYGHNFGITDG